MTPTKSKRSLSRLNKKKLFIELLVIFVSIGVIGSSFILMWVSSLQMPDFNSIAERQVESTTKIYDRTGKILLFAFRENIRRTEVPMSEISENLKKATVAIEDDGFYTHKGISIRGIARALYVNIVSGKVQGGSTITQQVVKNALLTQDRTLERKIKEVILAVKLEQTLSKEQILSMYLNDGPYGGEIYGVEEASLYYFGKHAKDLNITESAYLAAIPKNPPLYSPYIGKRDKLEERKDVVLRRMLETGNITQEEYDAAKATVVTFVKKEDNSSKALHFVFYIKDYLEKKYGEDFMTKGFSVTTTLDYDLQKSGEEEAKKHIADYIRRNNTVKYPLAGLNTGLIALDASTSQILMMVGSRDYNDPNIDGQYNVTTALRQPGSSIKPLIYAAGFEAGLDPETVVFDTATEFNLSCPPADGQRRDAPCYSPQNYDESFFGALSIRESLGNSRNVPAVKVLYLVGVQNAINFAKKLGITTLKGADRYGLSLVLGGGEVSLLELSSAYGAFAQDGVYRKPTGILEIKDKNGKILEGYKDSGYQAISEDTAGKISSVLSDNNARSRVFGYNSKLHFPGVDVAAKTGTTNNVKDGWVVGYTRNVVLGGWIGKNDNTSFGEVNASLSIVPLWNTMMYKVLKKYPAGSLNTEYAGNPEVDGVKCSADGAALDIIHTAIQNNLFPNIVAGDGQASRWVYQSQSSLCGYVEVIGEATSTDITVESVPLENQNPAPQINPEPTPIQTQPQ